VPGPRHRGSFDDAVSRLNSGNSNELWELAALLTVLEYYGSSQLDLFPALHPERPRLLCDAILRSNASFHRHRAYAPREFVDIINWSSEGLLDPRIEAIGSGRPRDEMLFDLTRAIARWGNIQIKYQDVQNADVGRAIALYEVLPETAHFRDSQTADLVHRVRVEISGYLGCRVPELLLVYTKAGLRSRWLFERVASAVKLAMPGALKSEQDQLVRLSAILQWLYSERSRLSPSVSFTAEELRNLWGVQSRPEAVSAFLKCWSSDTRTLRSLLDLPAYAAGSGSWRLSPLERYPVLQLDRLSPKQAPSFVVPNFRFYLCSMPRPLDYALQEGLGDEYNQFRGAVYEEYVAEMLGEEYPGALVISERSYRPRKVEAKGPDVVFVEAIGEPLILVEVKARRVSAKSRSDMDDEALDANLEDAYSALGKLASKADDLFAGLEEYAEVKPFAAGTSRDATLCVCVLPDTPFAVNELTHYRVARGDLTLGSLDLRFCIMSVATLETAISCAKTTGSTVAAVLGRFIERASVLEMHGPLAEFFGEAKTPLGPLYGERFLQRLAWPPDGEGRRAC
jgi:hypothetical protein